MGSYVPNCHLVCVSLHCNRMMVVSCHVVNTGRRSEQQKSTQSSGLGPILRHWAVCVCVSVRVCVCFFACLCVCVLSHVVPIFIYGPTLRQLLRCLQADRHTSALAEDDDCVIPLGLNRVRQNHAWGVLIIHFCVFVVFARTMVHCRAILMGFAGAQRGLTCF